MASIRIRGLAKDYGAVTALKSLDLDIEDEMLLTLLGPSGCGKTITLKLIAGPNADSTSGLTTFASAQFPFSIVIGVGLALLFLDIVRVKNGKSLGRKLVTGAIVSLLPFVLIYVIFAYLPNPVPLASSLLGGQQIPAQATQLVGSIAGSPISGSATQSFPVVGATTVAWGYGIGAYLFVAAAFIKVLGGGIMRSAQEPAKTTAPSPPMAQ